MKQYIIIHILLFVAFGVFFTNCNKKGAQYPSNKARSIDSTDIKLRDYNKELARREDSAISDFLAKQPFQFKKTESGIRYYIQNKSELQPVASDSAATFSYKAYSIEGNPVFQENDKTIRFGKKEIVTGLEEGLKLMKKGEVARLVVPWYLAYGAQGNEVVEPYTTIIFVVETDR